MNLQELIDHTHIIGGCTDDIKPAILEVNEDKFKANRHLLLLGDIDEIHARQRDMYGGGIVILRRMNYVPSDDDPTIVTLDRVQRYRFSISLKDGGTFDSPPRIDGAESKQVESCLVTMRICANVLKGATKILLYKLKAMTCNEVKEFTGNKNWNAGAIFNVKKQEYLSHLLHHKGGFVNV